MEWVSHQDTVEWRLYTGGVLSWLWQSSQPSLEVVRVALQPESRESAGGLAAENERRTERRSVSVSGGTTRRRGHSISQFSRSPPATIFRAEGRDAITT